MSWPSSERTDAADLVVRAEIFQSVNRSMLGVLCAQGQNLPMPGIELLRSSL